MSNDKTEERAAFEAWATDGSMLGRHVLDRQGDGYWSSHTQLMWEAWQARAALSSRPVQGGEQSGEWEGAEEWMPLAWELCANECGEEACTELIWEGGPIPEPWGDRWMKYEGQAKEMIAMVRKHVPALAAQPVREPMSLEQRRDGYHAARSGEPGSLRIWGNVEFYYQGIQDAERHHGITKE